MADNERVTCDVCGKSFDSRKQMKQHKHDLHDKNDAAKEIKSHSNVPFKIISKKMTITIISVGILIAVAAGVGDILEWPQTYHQHLS
jgi:uncharacterized membrane protein YvbJ